MELFDDMVVICEDGGVEKRQIGIQTILLEYLE